jgi:predicted aldo/keto reductase-like oxidoreductase
LDIHNQLRFSAQINVGMRVESMPEGKRPVACTACGACVKMCPQNIDIPTAMKWSIEALAKLPSWAEICRQRDEAARAGRTLT